MYYTLNDKCKAFEQGKLTHKESVELIQTLINAGLVIDTDTDSMYSNLAWLLVNNGECRKNKLQ